MHLHLELCYEGIKALCSKCERVEQGLGVVAFLGNAGEIPFGNVDAPFFCLQCLEGISETRVLEIIKEEAPKRTPPTKSDKRKSRKQELRIADDIGGRRQPGSGNQAHAKGDVRKKGEFRIEAKFTRAKQFTLKREELDKINGECSYGEKPVFHIDFISSVTDKVDDSWVAIPYDDWKELVDAAGKNRGPGSTGGGDL